MITLPGQLAIKTIHGRNGDFNVGKLATSIGEFVTKNAELDQYREGKYDGDFTIVEIRPSMYTTGGRMVIELRAVLGGMTLSNIESLTKDEAHGLSPQEVDPVDEEVTSKPPQEETSASIPIASTSTPTRDPLKDPTPFGDEPPADTAAQMNAATQADVALFGSVWPLGAFVKLDPTVDRRMFRRQRDRLDQLGYEFEALTQEWHLKAA